LIFWKFQTRLPTGQSATWLIWNSLGELNWSTMLWTGTFHGTFWCRCKGNNADSNLIPLRYWYKDYWFSRSLANGRRESRVRVLSGTFNVRS
jgi:hypothetical protein